MFSEATLDDLLHDPITQLLMARDGVTEADVRALAEQWRSSRAARRFPSKAVGELRSFEPEDGKLVPSIGSVKDGELTFALFPEGAVRLRPSAGDIDQRDRRQAERAPAFGSG